MRILITVHQFLPDFSAGTEIIALGVARELVRRGHEVRIFTGFPGARVPQLDDSRLDHYVYDGLRVDRFTHAYVPMGGENNIALLEHDNPLAGRFFSSVLREFKPDVVHAFHLARVSTSIIPAAVRAGAPVVFTATDFWFTCPLSQLLLPGNKLCAGPSAHAGNCIQHIALVEKNTRFRRALYQAPTALVDAAGALVRRGWFPATPFNAFAKALVDRPALMRERLGMCAKIIAPSKTMQATLIAHGVEPDRIIRVPYGIDVEHIRREAPKARGPRLRVGFIGTLAPHKGPQVLIRALRLLDAALPISLAIHGSADPTSPFGDELRALAQGEDRITMAGAFSNDRVSEILGAMDVLVAPSLWLENTPRVISEAQAAGCAVIASDLGGMSESVRPGEDGLLFPAGDADALAKLLARLCNDRDLASKLADGAKQPMSVSAHVDGLERVYRGG
ncbi:MAG: glycosyltransferase family 4 protein [Planctomycetota bacterium]|nr:glycosyltransferase family 4 protein [Planctomycetota bacterium]